MMMPVPTRAQVNSKNKDGDLPLHWAASGGHLHCASQLIDAKANIWAPNNDGTTALHFAAAEGHFTLVQLFLEVTHPPPHPPLPR
jgi:ankyrin repeat protein